MHLHEFQAKNLLHHYGIAIPPFTIASSVREARRAIQDLGLEEAVIKIQVHAGGRGKGGGVKFAKNSEEALRIAEQLIGMRLVNNQTGPGGVIAEKVLISAPINIKKEYYLAAIIDRKEAAPTLIVSSEGGIEIEETAANQPSKILKEKIGLDGRVHAYQLLTIAKFLGWEGDIRAQGIQLIDAFAKAFIESDASLLEINPLVETHEGSLVALDAKCTIDDNALYRQPALTQYYDPSQQTKGEVMAKEFDLAYVGLEGEIGCMVNGAGLAMATMDIIQHFGGMPANFLDVGGGASMEKVAHGFKIILMDERVKVIFVNIFGGIMDCEILAKGIVEASKQDQVRVPLVIRMEGTNVDKGKRILQESGLSIATASTMAEGAQMSVKAAKGI